MTNRPMTTRPTIVGPDSWPAHAPPPRFTVDTAGRSLFMVELAMSPVLMTSVVHRCAGNYFYGGDGESAFATGRRWCIPLATWAHLGRGAVLFYRVVAVDQGAGGLSLSVDDRHLDALPWLVVETPDWRPRRTETP